MPRKKLAKPENLWSHRISFRVTESFFKKLEKLQQESDCHSVSEVARKILCNKRINCFYRDISLTGPVEEMALIRKEIKAIGISINQHTHHFHMSGIELERAFHVLKTAELYKSIGGKIDRLLIMISKLAEKWLPKQT